MPITPVVLQSASHGGGTMRLTADKIDTDYARRHSLAIHKWGRSAAQALVELTRRAGVFENRCPPQTKKYTTSILHQVTNLKNWLK